MTINYIVFQQFVCSFRFGAIVIRGRVVNFTLHVHFISSSLRVKNMHPFSTVQAKFIQLASSLASSVGCTVSTPMIMWIAEKTFSTPSHSHKTDTGPTIYSVSLQINFWQKFIFRWLHKIYSSLKISLKGRENCHLYNFSFEKWSVLYASFSHSEIEKCQPCETMRIAFGRPPS